MVDMMCNIMPKMSSMHVTRIVGIYSHYYYLGINLSTSKRDTTSFNFWIFVCANKTVATSSICGFLGPSTFVYATIAVVETVAASSLYYCYSKEKEREATKVWQVKQ